MTFLPPDRDGDWIDQDWVTALLLVVVILL